MITPYITLSGHKEFERNKTGFGYMVIDIAKAIAKQKQQVDLLVTDTCGKDFEHEDVFVLKRALVLYFLRLFYCLPFLNLLRIRRAYSMSNSSFARLGYYWLMTGYLKYIIQRGHYDIVHIHGCDFADELWMSVCKQCGQKYVITLHGLNSFSDTVQLEYAGKEYERNFLKRVIDGDIPITVISTGMKKLIEKTFNVADCRNITVVCNSFSFLNTDVDEIDIRKKYKLTSHCKIVLCVGNICRRKNQGQLISAFNLLQESLARDTYLLFLGGNIQPDYTIELLSESSPWKSHFISCGVVPKEYVSNYYKQCDGVALISLSEGFGLSLIEGMNYGKPCISFTDIDAFIDIYHPAAMIGVDKHTDESVAKGLTELLIKKWNSPTIRDYSKKFQSSNMAKEYITVYQNQH